LRIPGEATLPFWRKQTVGGEPRLRTLECLATKAVALRLDATHSELHLTARWVYGELSLRNDEHAVVRPSRAATPVARPDDAADLGVAIAEAEVPVAVAVGLEVDDFATNPERKEGAFDHVASGLRERGDRHRGLRARSGEEIPYLGVRIGIRQ